MIELPHEVKVGVPLMLSDVRHNLERAELVPADMTPAELFRKACEVAVDHWLVTSEDHRLRCACGVLILLLIEDERHEEKRLVERELATLGALSAAMSGVPVDFSRVLEEPEDAHAFVGLLKIWQETREGGKG